MENKSNKTNFAKILIPVAIVVIVIGLWFVKNNEDKLANAQPIATNVDFELISKTMDFEKIKSHGLPIMLDFGADDCVPCQEMAPVLKQANIDYQGKAVVKFFDVWKDQSLAEGFPVEVVPTQFFFTADGKPFVPSNPDAMQMIMYSSKETNEHIFTAHQGGLSKEQIDAIFLEMGAK